jgi:hypothetical protein
VVSTSALTPTGGDQCVSFGLGHHFISSKKPRDKKKTQKHVELPSVQAKHCELLACMQQLMNPEPKQSEIHAIDAVETVFDRLTLWLKFLIQTLKSYQNLLLSYPIL